MSDKKLFLLDGYALIYRAHYAFINRPLINSKGFNTSAVTGFVRTLWDILQNEEPSHIAVAMDTSGPTFRHERYPEYKANREEQPEDITKSIPYILDILRAFDIPVLMQQGIEADDIIGTLARVGEEQGFEVFMVTPDKDFGQLVTENVKMYKPSRQGNGVDIWGVEDILKKWDIENVDQVVDMLGLQGDSSDNIPGVRGIGPKTAAKLLKQYPSIEEIYENIENIKGSARKKLEENRENAFLSKELARIKTDCDLPFDTPRLKIGNANREAIAEIFNELEFRRLKQAVLGETEKPEPVQRTLFSADSDEKAERKPLADLPDMSKKNLQNTEHNYILVDNEKTLKALTDKLSKSARFCFDTETTSLQAVEAELVGIAFAFETGEAYYLPVPDGEKAAKDAVAPIKAFLEDDEKEKIGQNLKYDIMVLKNVDIHVGGHFWDTMLMHYLLEPGLRHNMNYLAESYLNYKPKSIEDLIGKKSKKKKQGSMRDVPIDEVVEYAGEDADITLQLYDHLRPALEKEKGLFKLYHDVEEPLIQVLADMEYEGIRLDTEFLREYASELQEQITDIEKKIYELSGTQFNISSPKQVGEILFDKLNIPYRWKKTKSGQYSTSEEKLDELRDKHEIIPLILKHRMMRKLLSTYVEPLPQLVSSKTGRVHTHFNQALTATGRLSSNNPNVQNIPIRTPEGRKVRKAFVPRDDQHVLLAADYSQIELRIMAAVSKDEKMMAAFNKDLDIHTATAANVFGVPMEEVTKEQRRRAKTVNFSIIYGAGATNLSQQLDISRSEASDLIDQYFKQYSGVKEYMDKVVQEAREKGFVQTRLGRKRELRDINSKSSLARGNAERMAINTPIQGTAADMIKIAMRRVYDKLIAGGFKTDLLMQVHDELVFDVPKDELKAIQPIVKEEMQQVMPDFEVPIIVEMDTGEDWLEAH
ncbi:MAG TPA: DNA polymerase I [Saprospiraceae bacterium]|nr:DNA polymerase I [Saprospiraceae bacterium]